MNKPPITATGLKGFLLWFKREQPDLFNKIAPKLPQAVPKAFSNYTANQRLKKIYRGQSYSQRALNGFADYDVLPEYTVYAASTAPVSVDYGDLTTPDYDSAIDVNGVITAPVDSTAIQTANIPSPVAIAANSGSSGTGIASAIGQVIGAASSAYLTSQQQTLQQQALATNLARAAAGLPPLNTSLNALGVPTISTGAGIFGNSSTLIIVGIAAAIALAMSQGGSRKMTAGDL
jgi:hypothetical protein